MEPKEVNRSVPIIITDHDKDRLMQLVLAFSTQKHDALIEFLRRELDRASVVSAGQVPRSVATMNSRVRYQDNLSKEIFTVSLVYPGQEDSWLGRISILNPTGAALLGLSEGQTINWTTLDGLQKSLTLLKVLFQPEAAGRFDL